MNIHLPLALSLLLAAPQPALGDKLDALLKHEMRLRRIPGVAFAVVDHGRVVAKRTYGFANLETGTRVRSDSVFEVASVTKPFTATAVMALAEEGKLNLDNPISKFIDGTPATWKSITVRHLLSHTSGLPGGSPVKRDGSPLLEITTRQQYDDVLMCALASAPGERGLYSDPGYFLLGMIIEKVSGLPYNQFMEKRIFGPAGMKSSRIGDRRAIVRNHASCYLLRDGQLENDRRVWQHELPSFFGMWTTVDDLVKWNSALERGRILKPETLMRMWTPTRLNDGQPALVDGYGYGLGWFVVDVGGHRFVGHPGFHGSAMFRVVDQDLAVIVLTNLDTTTTFHNVVLVQEIISTLRPDLPRFFGP